MASLLPSVIIPAYNEEKRIGKTFRSVLGFSSNGEIIVVMDGCTDRTKEIVYGLEEQSGHKVVPLLYEHRLGKGGAIMKGLKYASGDVIVLLDADGGITSRDLWRLIDEIDRYDLVVASRYSGDSRIILGESPFRVFLGRGFNMLIKMMFWRLRRIRDTQCGVKVFRRSLVGEIGQDLFITDFAFDVNLIYSALRHGLKVKEVGVTWNHTDDSSKVSGSIFKLCLKMLLSLVRLRICYSKAEGFLDSRPMRILCRTIYETL